MKTIYPALVKAQAEMGNAHKDKNNPHFKSKYADLASVRSAVLPSLNKNGIVLLQPFVQNDLGHSVKTQLIHAESGDMIECDVPLILGKNDMQGLGAAITYARRYGILLMSGIAPADDSDGNNTTGNYVTVGDAWKDGVLDSLPDNASPSDKATAFANAIVKGFKSKTGEKALSNEWDRRQKMIEEFEQRFPALHERCVDTFETQMQEIAPMQSVPE